jgi:hypothetical protein
MVLAQGEMVARTTAMAVMAARVRDRVGQRIPAAGQMVAMDYRMGTAAMGGLATTTLAAVGVVRAAAAVMVVKGERASFSTVVRA